MPAVDDKPEYWEVYFPADTARDLASQPSFHALLAFARAMNVVRFGLEDLTRDLDATRPADRRRFAGTLFHIGGQLNEIRTASNRLGQWYRDLSAYATLAEVWKGDPLGKPPLNALIAVRNTAV